MVETTKFGDSDTTALPSAAGIADTVAAHLAPVTRFRRDDISQETPDRHVEVDLTLTRVQQVQFDVAWHAGAGHLPPDVTLLANGTRLKVQLNTQLGLARDGCDDALRAWVAHAPQAYRRVLPADAAFRHTPGRYGIEFTCQSCYGKCQTQCSLCAGAGKVSCAGCQGSGTLPCEKCGGSTRLSCTACVGSGHITEQVSEQRWDAAKNAFVSSYVPVNRPCTHCSGSGSTHCTACTFGQAQCATCAGKSTVPCKGCVGKGHSACAECAGSGAQHEWACVTAAVSAVEDLTFGIVEPALETLIRDHIAIADLPDYGSYLEAHHVVDAGALGSRYELRVDATRAKIHVASREFCLYGLGPQAQVFDFVDITGQLLDDDMATLERAVAASSLWTRPQDTGLLDALKLFISSEQNLRIAQPPAALNQGLKRVFGARLVRPAAWVVGSAGLLSALLYAFGPASFGPWHCTFYASIAGVALGLAAEAWSLGRIRQFFPERFGEQLKSHVTAASGISIWRMAILIGVFASASLGARIASKIPYLTRLHEGVTAVQLAPDNAKVEPVLSIEENRSTADKEGLYEIRQEARKFLVAHNKKNNTRFKALDPNLNETYPKCSTPLAVSWVPKSYGLAQPAVFVRCKKSVSEHGRKWEAIVRVSKRGN